MEILTDSDSMRRWSWAMRSKGKTVGLVPTMGKLHDGHLSLVRGSLRECDVTVTSIFVNPTQFGANEDLDRYPRDLDGDRRLLEREGCHALFTTTPEKMYPKGFETWVIVDKLPRHLCGLKRIGHFRGVTTVVTKLFNIVSPDRAFFGWKDAQQALIIRRMVQDLNMQTEIRIMPIIRDEQGLALSSRNAFLSPAEHRVALRIPRAVELAKEHYRSGGRDGRELLRQLTAHFHGIDGLAVDYISLVRIEDLEDTDVLGPGTVLALAVFVGDTRLIDNCRFHDEPYRSKR